MIEGKSNTSHFGENKCSLPAVCREGQPQLDRPWTQLGFKTKHRLKRPQERAEEIEVNMGISTGLAQTGLAQVWSCNTECNSLRLQ